MTKYVLKPVLQAPSLHGVSTARPPKQARRLGEAAPCDILHNCLTCSRWPSCVDNHKSAFYRCTRYREAVLDESLDLEGIMATSDLYAPDAPTVSEKEFDVATEDDLNTIIEKILSSNVPIPPDLKVDDRDIPQAANLMEWLTDPQFAGVGVPPFPRQVELGIKLFAEYCPKCSDTDWFDEMPHDVPIPEIRDRVVFLENGVCPCCSRTRNDLIRKGWLLDPFSVVGVAGQRSAKTTSVIMWDAYNDHRILKTPNPAALYGLLSSQTLMTSFTALTFGQAVENIWVPFRSVITEYPWYKNYHAFLDAESHRLGEDLYTVSEQFARYRHRNFFISPASPSKRVMRGRTRVGAVCLSGDALITTTEGLIPIETMAQTEHEYDVIVDGRIERCRGAWCTGVHTTYEITMENGVTLRATADHKFPTYNVATKTYETVALRDMTTDHRLLWDGSGSRFRNKIPLSFEDFIAPDVYNNDIEEHERTLQGQRRKAILSFRGHFYMEDILRVLGVRDEDKNPITVITSKLRRAGFISATREPTFTGYRNRYRVLNNDFDAYMRLLEQERRNSGRTHRRVVPTNDRRNAMTYPKYMCQKLAWLLAAMVCDGSYRSDVEFSYNTSNTDKLNTFLSHLKDLFNYEPTVTSTTVKTDRMTQMYKVHLGQGGFKLFMRHVGLTSATAYDKETPWSVLQGPDDAAYAYLASYALHAGGMKRNRLLFHSVSFTSREGIQLLLARLGYYARNRGNLTVSVFGPQQVRRLYKKFCKYGNVENIDKYEYGDVTFTGDKLNPNYLNSHGGKHKVAAPTPAPGRKDTLLLGVRSIKKYGKEKVYTMNVDSRAHEYVANGIKSRNCDEIGWYPLARTGAKKGNAGGQDFERLDARGVRDALVNSLFTTKAAYRQRLEEGYHVPKPVFYAVSSTQSVNDAIMTFYREAQGSKEILSFIHPTWEFNPKIKRSDLDEYFRNDVVAANRDFACIPPIGEGLFLSDAKATAKVFGKKYNGFATQTFAGLSKTGKKITTSRVKMLTNMAPDYPVILAVDVGLTNNSFSFSIVGLPNDYEPCDPEDRGTHLNPVQVFAVGEVIPQPGTRISITHLYDGCFKALMELYDIAYFVSDRWNNVKIAQDLEENFDVVPIEYQCKWDDFSNLRELIETGNIELPKMESSPNDVLETTLDNYPDVFRRRPIDHLYYQMCTVREQTNVTVLKGDGVTDDSFRTIVLGAALMQDEEVFEFIETNRNGYSQENTGALGVTQGYSSGGSATGGQTITNQSGVTVAGLFRSR